MKSIVAITGIILLYYLSSCANPVSPTGGNKDTQSPLIIKIDTLIKNNQKYVHIQFDENINFKNNLHFVPYSKISSDQLKIENQSVTIRIPANLNAISLNESISDVNENNLGHYPFIVLGKDTAKQVIKIQHPIKDNKIKIKGYSLIDTFIYKGDNFINNSIRFEALKPDKQFFHIYADQNNNDKLDDNEYYYINSIKPSKDTAEIKLYPSIKNPVFYNHLNKTKYSLYITQNTLFKDFTDSLSLFLNHLDSFLILKSDSNVIKQFTNKLQIPLKLSKASITETTKENIYQNKLLNDTNIYREYSMSQLLNSDTLPYAPLTNFNSIKSNITISPPATHPKNKIKLGEIILQNDSFSQITVSIYQNNKSIFSKKLTLGNENVYLPIGKYQLLAWIDQNDNNYCDHQDYNYEKIIHYYTEITVNDKLSNTFILHKANKPSANVNLDVNIARPDIE